MNMMRRFLTIFFIFICNLAFAKTVIIGNGKGVVSKTNMKGLRSRRCIGNYTGKIHRRKFFQPEWNYDNK